MQSDHSSQAVEIFTAQMQYRKVFQPDDQTEQGREKLRKDRSPCGSRNTHMERYNKQDIQKNIQNRRKHQEIKWCFAVTKCTEHV